MKTICPKCNKKMEREKWWFDQGVMHHGCVYCYLNWRKAWLKRRSGNYGNDDSDDIL